jgi:hypothetical protein
MVLVSYSGREINAKLVYYGPGLSGKTTNLEFIYSSIPQGQRGKMVSMKTKTERTLFFDFLPVHLGELSGFKTRFLLYTVPGQVYYNATRKLVLKGVDAVVFVADSKRGKMDENVESLENLKENLKDLGLSLDRLPWVIQYNKRDLSDIYALAELEAVLNPGRVPAYEGVASNGVGVVETFKGISRLLLRKLARDVGVPVVGSTAEADASTRAPAAVSGSPIVAAPVAVPAAPVDRATGSPASAVPDVPVNVYAAAPAGPAWAPPAPPLTEVPVTVYAPRSSWTAEEDAEPRAFRLETEPHSVSDESSSPPGDEPGAAVPGTQFPPVAEPVRMLPPGSGDTSVWASRGDGDEPSEHHVSVGERLRRWLSRAPEPDGAADERRARPPEVAEPLPVPAFQAEIPSTPTPLPQPEPEPFQPVGEFMAAKGPAAAPAAGSIAEPAATLAAEPAVAAFDAPKIPVPPLAAQSFAISQLPIPEAVHPQMPAVQAGTPTVTMPLPSAALPTPPLASAAPPPARATQPALRRRRPREIIVPLELSPDDLAEGVVLKVAIRMQQVAGDPEDEADQYAA